MTGEEYTISFDASIKGNIASLDAEEGILTCYEKGSVKVTVKLTCGTQKKTARLTITIKEPEE